MLEYNIRRLELWPTTASKMGCENIAKANLVKLEYLSIIGVI
jgi:hypothetical protein